MERLHHRVVFKKSLKNYYKALENMINQSTARELIIDTIVKHEILPANTYKLTKNKLLRKINFDNLYKLNKRTE